jgi:hypothetical protein
MAKGSDWNPATASPEERREVFGARAPGTGGNKLIYKPKPTEVGTFSRTRLKVCGNCRSFNHGEGQKRLFKDKQALTIVHDHQWKLEHLGDDPRRLGICDMAGDTLTGPMSKACDQWRGR